MYSHTLPFQFVLFFPLFSFFVFLLWVNVLLPFGLHSVRCINSQWIHAHFNWTVCLHFPSLSQFTSTLGVTFHECVCVHRKKKTSDLPSVVEEQTTVNPKWTSVMDALRAARVLVGVLNTLIITGMAMYVFLPSLSLPPSFSPPLFLSIHLSSRHARTRTWSLPVLSSSFLWTVCSPHHHELTTYLCCMHGTYAHLSSPPFVRLFGS